MKRATTIGAAVMTILAGFPLDTSAITKGNPYEMIIARNPFGLRPIPRMEPPPPALPPQQSLPGIKITGITTLLGEPKALFQYEDQGTKKTEFPPLLAEGQSYKMLSVLQIDPENQWVRIKNGYAEMVLDFIANGVKPTPATAVASAGSSLSLPPHGVSSISGGRVVLGGPVPTQTLPATILERMKQLQERAQAEEAARLPILPISGLGDALNRAPTLPIP